MILEYALALAMSLKGDTAITKATYYSPKYENKKMANGQKYHSYDVAVAYNKWPVGTWVKIINPKTKDLIVVRITDRKKGPGIDLSEWIYDFLELPRKKGSGTVIVERVK